MMHEMGLERKKATIIGSAHQFFGMLMVPVLIPYLLLQGFSEQTIAFYWMIFPLVGIFASLGLGEAVKKIHVSWLLFFFILLNASAIPFYLIAQDWSIIVARILDGLSFTSITILSLTKLETHITSKRGSQTGAFLFFQQTAKYSAPLIGGFLGEVFILLPIFMSFIGLLFLSCIIDHPHFYRKEKHKVSVRGDLKKYLLNAHTRFSTILGLLANMLLAFRDIFIPLMIISTFGLTVQSVGIATTLFGLGSIFQIVLGPLSDKITHRKGMIYGLVGVSLGWMSIALFASSYILFLGMLLIVSFSNALFNVSIISYIGSGKRKDTGTSFSFYATFSKIGTFIGTGLIGVLLGFLGFQSIIVVIASLGLTGLLVTLVLYPNTTTNKK